jgi:hypothetical protein
VVGPICTIEVVILPADSVENFCKLNRKDIWIFTMRKKYKDKGKRKRQSTNERHKQRYNKSEVQRETLRKEKIQIKREA